MSEKDEKDPPSDADEKGENGKAAEALPKPADEAKAEKAEKAEPEAEAKPAEKPEPETEPKPAEKAEAAAAEEARPPKSHRLPERKAQAWGRPLARLDAAWTKWEIWLCAITIVLEILVLTLWVGLKGLSTAPDGNSKAGLVFRALFGAI